jgi:hypothetical protein
MLDLGEYPLLATFLVSLTIILVASEAGRWLGRRAAARNGSNDSTLEAAVLGLLALMISFTFAMALSRFEARRDAVLDEANAIGTTALRARLLPAPHDTESLKLLQNYVQLRLEITQRTPSPQDLEAAITRSNAIQEGLWQQAMAVAANATGVVPTGVYIQTLNEMIDNQEKRLTALRNRVPDIVLTALYGIAVIAGAFAGYGAGVESRRSRLPVYLTGVLVASVILLIQDLDRPGGGFIRVSQQPMIDTADAIASYADTSRIQPEK